MGNEFDKKWVFRARQNQMLHKVVVGEGGTVNKLAKAAGCSISYAHNLLAALVGRGDVVKVEEKSKRYGTVHRYYSEFYYVTELAGIDIRDLDKSRKEYEMIEAYMERDCSAAEWYGFAAVELEVVKQLELF